MWLRSKHVGFVRYLEMHERDTALLRMQKECETGQYNFEVKKECRTRQRADIRLIAAGTACDSLRQRPLELE